MRNIGNREKESIFVYWRLFISFGCDLPIPIVVVLLFLCPFAAAGRRVPRRSELVPGASQFQVSAYKQSPNTVTDIHSYISL